MTDNAGGRISAQAMADVFGLAYNQSLITDDDTSVIFYDLSFLESKINELRENFEESALHAVAIKACPLVAILHEFNKWGVGLEAASLPELHLARKTGFSSDRIVFDSPVKTADDLKYAMKAAVYINADSLDELDRIAEIKKQLETRSTFGLRINPQVGSGRIKTTSVASEYSKFGVPINEFRREIIEAYKLYNWLTGIHLHIGSQGIPLEMLVEGVKKVYALAEEINSILAESAAPNRIDTFDIGGGLPAIYSADDPGLSVAQYAKELRREVPGIFGGRYKLVTEFGRHINANAAWAAARVEYIKRQGDTKTVLTHLGADLFIRECYNPEDWHHDISVIDKQGNLISGPESSYIIAGPLCFAGDIIAGDAQLPVLEAGDYLLIHDIGAYTLSMWSRYNSRQMPKVIGYFDNGRKFDVLKKRENLDDIYDFWQ